MTSALLVHSQLGLRIGVFSALAGGFGVACCSPAVQNVYPRNTQAFVLPPGCPAGSAPGDTTQLRACLNGIEFDTVEAIGDEQRLLVRDAGGAPCHGDTTHTCRHGPLAKVEPVKGAEMYSDSAMVAGRIIARIYLRAGETETYPKYGLVPVDTTYWWVSTSGNMSYFVHRSGSAAQLDTLSRPLTRTAHPPGTFQQAFAAWIWDETDETLNGGCSGHCCKS